MIGREAVNPHIEFGAKASILLILFSESAAGTSVPDSRPDARKGPESRRHALGSTPTTAKIVIFPNWPKHARRLPPALLGQRDSPSRHTQAPMRSTKWSARRLKRDAGSPAPLARDDFAPATGRPVELYADIEVYRLAVGVGRGCLHAQVAFRT